MVNHDCGGSSKEWCRRGVCARGQCDSHFHCDKLEFSCCKKQFSNESSECKEHCTMNLVAQTMTGLDQMNVVAQIISVHQIVRKIFLYG